MLRWFRRACVYAFATFLACQGAVAAQLVCAYEARLSGPDHFNSRGARLTSAAAIIRQDRFHYHVQGQRDPEDEGDCFFASKRNREILERLLDRGQTTLSARRAIVDGTPMVSVRIYRHRGQDYVNVDVH
jgi:hypothetical protein